MYRYRNNCPCEKQNAEMNHSNNDNSNQMDPKCQCGFTDDQMVFPTNFMYGQSYVPIQYIDETFKPEVALKMGTLFPELVSPYEPCQNMREMAYLREATRNEGQCPHQRN